jgi:hypothetical protein
MGMALSLIISSSAVFSQTIFSANSKTTEFRYFLSSVEMALPDRDSLDHDTKQNWSWKAPGYTSPNPHFETFEAKFKAITGKNGDDGLLYILKELQYAEEKNAIHSLDCSFIYRFAGNGGKPEYISDTDTLFRLHYRLMFMSNAHDSVIREFLQTITWKDYPDSVRSSYYKSHDLEPESLRKFPSSKRYPIFRHTVAQDYAFMNTKLNIDNELQSINAFKSESGHYHFAKLDCWVEKRKFVPIWVRGLRVLKTEDSK